jgi:hypothetical protein
VASVVERLLSRWKAAASVVGGEGRFLHRGKPRVGVEGEDRCSVTVLEGAKSLVVEICSSVCAVVDEQGPEAGLRVLSLAVMEILMLRCAPSSTRKGQRQA